MTKKVKKSILRILLGVSLLIGSIASVQVLTPPQPIFASMGSTGGGHVSGGGGGGGSHFSPSHTYNSTSDDSSDEESHITPLGAIGCLLIISLPFLPLIIALAQYKIHELFTKLRLRYEYDARRIYYDLMWPNMDLKWFLRVMQKTGVQMKVVADKDKYSEFGEVYIRAQYLYSQDAREKYVNPKYSLRNLLEYLDPNYYHAMKAEINLKVKEATIDDTVVSRADIVEIAKLGKNIWLTRVDAKGKDREVQFDKNFEDSFTRSKWSDYVIFGKDREGKIKIINLVYGEHFHLNGKDFNHQKSLGNGDYKEKKL